MKRTGGNETGQAFGIGDGRTLELEAKVNAIMNVLTGEKSTKEKEKILEDLQEKIRVDDTNQAAPSLLEALKMQFSEKY